MTSTQLTDNYGVTTPVDWQDGEAVVISSSIATTDAKTKFQKGGESIKPYLQPTPTRTVKTNVNKAHVQ